MYSTIAGIEANGMYNLVVACTMLYTVDRHAASKGPFYANNAQGLLNPFMNVHCTM